MKGKSDNTIEANAVHLMGVSLSLGGGQKRDVLRLGSDGKWTRTDAKLFRYLEDDRLWFCLYRDGRAEGKTRRECLKSLAQHLSAMERHEAEKFARFERSSNPMQFAV